MLDVSVIVNIEEEDLRIWKAPQSKNMVRLLRSEMSNDILFGDPIAINTIQHCEDLTRLVPTQHVVLQLELKLEQQVNVELPIVS